MTSDSAQDWLVAKASVVGSGHVAAGLPNQDSFAIRAAGDALVLAVCDGAGSAARAETGAEIAAQTFAEMAAQQAAAGAPLAVAARQAFAAARAEVAQEASSAGAVPRDFACTLVAAILTPHSAVFTQIGDGVIVWREHGGSWDIGATPHRGTYANETIFLTDADAEERVEIREVNAVVAHLAALTDGLQSQVLDRDAITAEFLDPLITTLEANGRYPVAAIDEALGRLLDSDAARACSDDDKTLILVSRLQVALAQNEEHADAD